MAIIEGGGSEPDLTHLWAIITELGEQLSQNRSLSVSLYSQAGKIKHQAINSQTGFVLRRFNQDKTQEEYDAELEHMNATMAQENQSLQHDNKQLNALIKEYEQTLETLMSSFRNRAKDVQERELALIRAYEAQLLARAEEDAQRGLDASTAAAHSLAQVSHLLRQLLRAQGGEDAEAPVTRTDDAEDREPWAAAATAAADYALDREIELARLEAENEELRIMARLLPPRTKESSGAGEVFRPMFEAPLAVRLPSMSMQKAPPVAIPREKLNLLY